jgi:Cu(I)/Ag(I) efflux system membrane fusion protein
MNIKAACVGLIAAASLFATAAGAADSPALSGPAKSVFDRYLKIQAELARDSLAGVKDQANAIAKTVRADDTKKLPAALANQADALAKTGDLAGARQAFKALSGSLIKYLADNKAPKGTYYEVYCPMADASWLQANKKVQNPYMGKAMPDCGVVKD